MKFWNDLMAKYHHYMWSYYRDQERAKEVFIKLERANHCERWSDLLNGDPYDHYLTEAESLRWDAFLDVHRAEQHAIGDKVVKHHQKWMKYRGIV